MVPSIAVRMIIEELRDRAAPSAVWVRFCEDENRIDVYYDSSSPITGEDLEEYAYQKNTSYQLHIRNIRECINSINFSIDQTLSCCRRCDPGINPGRLNYYLYAAKRSIEQFRAICSKREKYLQKYPDIPSDVFDDCAGRRFSSMIKMATRMIKLVLNSMGETISKPRETVSDKVFDTYHGGDRRVWAEMLSIIDVMKLERTTIPFSEAFSNWKRYASTVESTCDHYALISDGRRELVYASSRETADYVQGKNVWDTYTDMVLKEAADYRSNIEDAKKELFAQAREESEELYLLFKEEFGDI